MEWIVGIDWGSETHQVEIQSEDASVKTNSEYSADVDGLYELRDVLVDKAEAPEDVKVGLEDPSRPIVRVLADAGMEIFILNPEKVSKYRSVYADSDAKSDELDAHVICEELRVHRNIFYKLVSKPPIIAKLAYYYRAMEDAKSDVTKLRNRLEAMLRDFFPRFLELDWNLTKRVMLDLLTRIPTPCAVDDVSVEDIRKVLGRCRKHTAEEVLEILGSQSTPLPDSVARAVADIAATQAEKLREAVLEEQHWLEATQELLEEISDRQKSDDLVSAASDMDGKTVEGSPSVETQDSKTNGPGDGSPADAEERLSDVEILRSTTGIGPRIAAGLLSEGFHSLVDLNREMLRRKSIAPVTLQTGTESFDDDAPDPQVRRRHARNRRLSQTMYHLGDSLQRHTPHYRARYADMRKKNQTHGRACRQISDQYLRVLFAMLRDRTKYDPTLHGATRR